MLTSELITRIKNTAATPDNQSGFSSDDILLLADDELNTSIVPMLLAARSEYLVYEETHTLTSNCIDIPYRAVVNGIRDIYYVEGGNKYDIPYKSPEDILDAQYSRTGSVDGFYFQGDTICFMPDNVVGKQVIIRYHMSASDLSTISGGKVTAINRTTGVVNVDIAPTGLSTSNPVDFIDGKSGMVLAYDITLNNLVVTALTFTPADIPARLEVGDYIFLKQKTPILPVPREVANLLVLRTAARLLESIGDFEALSRVETRANSAEKSLKALLEPRSRGGAKKLKGSGLIKSGSQRRLRVRY